VARLQDEEAERRAFIAVPYDAEIHKLNPFLGDNQTAQAEAEPATIPVFGHHRNLTIEGRLYKDPAAASVLKVAREINGNGSTLIEHKPLHSGKQPRKKSNGSNLKSHEPRETKLTGGDDLCRELDKEQDRER
jgi:hypothetical protein